MYQDLKQILFKPWTPKVIALCLAMLISVQLIFKIVVIFSLEKNTNSSPTTLPVIKSDGNNLKPPTGGLYNVVFGEYTSQKTSNNAIKKSTINLSIVGIIYSEDVGKSQVVISLKSGQDKVFCVGDKLESGERIKHITQDEIVIERNGTLESVNLPKNALGGYNQASGVSNIDNFQW